MSDVIEQYLKNDYRASLLVIDSYKGKTLEGRLYNPALPETKSFSNVMQLLLQMENLLNTLNFPQSFEQTRHFWPGADSADTATVQDAIDADIPERGKLASFSLKIVFRQNASWQGSVTWLDKGKEESFRSVLELLLLLDNALTV